MRRIVNSTFITRDDLVERLESWHFEYHDESAMKLAADMLDASDTHLMGAGIHTRSTPRRGRHGATTTPTRTYAMEDVRRLEHPAEPIWPNTSVIAGIVLVRLEETEQTEPTSEKQMRSRHRSVDSEQVISAPVAAAS